MVTRHPAFFMSMIGKTCCKQHQMLQIPAEMGELRPKRYSVVDG